MVLALRALVRQLLGLLDRLVRRSLCSTAAFSALAIKFLKLSDMPIGAPLSVLIPGERAPAVESALMQCKADSALNRLSKLTGVTKPTLGAPVRLRHILD